MHLRSRATLGRVLDDLGDALLDLVVGDAHTTVEIGGVVIHDRLDESVIPARSIVLGVGLSDPAEIATLLRELADRDAVALIVRAPIAPTAEISRAAAGGVALLGLRRGASWSHLTALLRSVIAADDVGPDDAESLGGLPSGDLFAVANAVAALMDAPVTIEDRESRVLAFSGRQDEADASRIETILGRQVPERYARSLAERGVFRELLRSERPIRVDPVSLGDGGFSVPRIAAPVRAGDEFLGSIWVAVTEELSPDRERGLVDASKLAALHLLRVRAGADVRRRLHIDLLSTALEGDSRAHAALARLGLADRPVVILGVTLTTPSAEPSIGDDVAREGELGRLADAFAMHLASSHPGASAALVGDVVYGLLPVSTSPGASGERAQRVARDFVERLARRYSIMVGIGPVATDVATLARARVTADRVLRVLRSGETQRRIAALDDVQTEVLLLELRDLALARGESLTGAVARLIEHDRENGTEFVATLRGWLDAFGDVGLAAAKLFVHPNTFRYRLRRLAGIGDIDLDDAEQRFASMLQLRVLAPPPAPEADR